MKKIQILVILFVAMSVSSCAFMESFCTHIMDNAPIDNNGSTYHNYSQNEAMDMIMNTREAQAWNSSTASKALLIGSAGLNLIESLTGKDFSVARGIMDATVDDLVADKNTEKSTEHSLIGLAFYGAGHAIGYVEDKHRDQSNAAFLEAHQKEIENDKYFFCRYKMDESGRYYNVRKRDGMMEVQKCIREQEEAEAQLTLDSALSQCVPFVNRSDLDEMAKGDKSEQMKRRKIIYDALKCFNENKRAYAYSYAENNEHESIYYAEEDHNSLVGNEESTKSDIAETESANIKMDIQQLEETMVNAYKINSYELSNDSKSELDNAVEILSRNPEWSIELRGHCCDLGDEQTNYTIGMLRAKEAKKYLIKNGVDESRISTISMGETQPLVANDTPAHRAQNRRVEIVIVK